MLQVNEIMQLSLFKGFSLICGEDALNNPVTGVVVLEYESIRTNYEAYNNGDFVLASLFFSRDNPSFVFSTIKTLIERHISGIAIKTAYDEKIPEELIELATQNNVPIFTFTDAYMEDLIISINESLKTKSQYLMYEEKLHRVVEPALDHYSLKQTARELNPSFLPNIFAAYITPVDDVSSITIHSYFKKLVYRQGRDKNSYKYSFVKYNNGIMLIYSFNSGDAEATANRYTIVFDLLRANDFVPSKFQIGIADGQYRHYSLDVCLKHAIYANFACKYQNESSMLYSGIGILKFLIPMAYDPIIYNDVSIYINRLKHYDKSYSSNLLQTLSIYINNNGDVSETAKEIFQHTNTVRYRIKKATSVMGLDCNNIYEQIYTIIMLYELHKIAKSYTSDN